MPKIYESPDNGKTVYSREFGELEREFEWMSPEEQSVREKLAKRREWDAILTAAETNLALQEAIERVKIIYHLGKKNGQK